MIDPADYYFDVFTEKYETDKQKERDYPETFDYAVDQVNHLLDLKDKYGRVNLNLLYLAGHSTGRQVQGHFTNENNL